MRIGRREGLAVAIGFVLVGAAFVLPRLNLGIKPRSDVLAVVIIGVLYIARDFIAHHTGWAFLGATPK